jgi:hypothetical protein
MNIVYGVLDLTAFVGLLSICAGSYIAASEKNKPGKTKRYLGLAATIFLLSRGGYLILYDLVHLLN